MAIHPSRTVGTRRHLHLAMLVLLAWATGGAAQGRAATDAPFDVRATVRAPDQIAAFYEARGFPPAAVAKLRSACFITVMLRNNTREIVWLEPERWRISATAGAITRLTRDDWERVWDELNVPAAQRATFGWTLLPEQRDLHPDEPVGGNITLPRPAGSVTLEMVFKTGADKRHGEIVLRYENLECGAQP